MILINQIDIFPFVFSMMFNSMYDCMITLRQVILKNIKWSFTMCIYVYIYIYIYIYIYNLYN